MFRKINSCSVSVHLKSLNYTSATLPLCYRVFDILTVCYTFNMRPTIAPTVSNSQSLRRLSRHSLLRYRSPSLSYQHLLCLGPWVTVTVTVFVLVAAGQEIVVQEDMVRLDVIELVGVGYEVTEANEVEAIELVKQELSMAGPGPAPFILSYRPHIALGSAGQVTSTQIESSTLPCAGTTVNGGLHL